MDRRKATSLAIALGIILIGVAIRWYRNLDPIPGYSNKGEIVLREPGTEHSHSSMLLFIDGIAFDFSQPQFQLQSDHVHFEDGDGIAVHKHAEGVTLPLLFRSLGMELSSDCLTMADKTRYCTEGKKVLTQYLNRKQFVDWDNYELQWNDKILIDYGETSEMDLALRLNAVPDLPEDL